MKSNTKKTILTIAMIVLTVFTLMTFSGCSESCQRSMKSCQSDYNGGLYRTVTVYDIEGEVIAFYVGKFDIVSDGTRILFDDENGMRHTIYFSVNTIITDEITEAEYFALKAQSEVSAND